MANRNMAFDPSDGLSNTTTYPSKPASGAAARTQVQGRLNEVRDHINKYVSMQYTDTGTANTYAVTMASTVTAYSAGLKLSFIAVNANTGASTLNVTPSGGAALGAVAIKKHGNVALIAGDILAGAIVEVEHDGTNFQLISAVEKTVPSCRVYHDANQSISNTTLTVLAFNSERYDTDTIHDNATNNSRLTCKTAGKYLISGCVGFAANATGIRQLYLRVNGSTFIAIQYLPSATASDDAFMTISTVYDLAVNDYVELYAYQSSGGNLNVKYLGSYTPEFMMTKIG